jgi:hypothetical protein
VNLESPKNRVLVGLVLLIVLVVLCSYYAAEHENHLKYPSYQVILSDYPQGEVVNVFGTVTHTDDGFFQIQENYNGQIVTMTIRNNTPVSVDDRVSVVGVLGQDNQIVKVEKIEVNEYWKYIFLLVRSFLVLIFLLYIFHRYWSFNWETFQFRRR